MKIDFVTAFFYPVWGGAEKHEFNLASELQKLKNKVTIYTSNIDRYNKNLKSKEIINKLEVNRYKVWFKIGEFASFFPGIYKAVKNSDSEIVHIHGYRNPHNLIALLTNKPCVMTLHWPNYPKGLRRKLNDFLIPIFDATIGKLILNKCKALIALNEAEKNWIIEKFNINKEKIKIIPNGIPEKDLRLLNDKIFRKKYKISENKILVLCIGRLHRSKGFDKVLNCAKYFPEVQFVIMGIKDQDTKSIENLTKENKNVLLLIDKNDKEKYEALATADIFIVPSEYEAFGIVVLEAFSQKCAVIGSDRGGLPYVIDKAGLTFKCEDLNDLKNKIELLVKDKKLRVELQNKGYVRAKEFTWDKIAKNVNNLNKEIIKNENNLRNYKK